MNGPKVQLDLDFIKMRKIFENAAVENAYPFYKFISTFIAMKKSFDYDGLLWTVKQQKNF